MQGAIEDYPSVISHSLQLWLRVPLPLLYILSAKENPYELGSRTVVLLMGLNIHLRGV